MPAEAVFVGSRYAEIRERKKDMNTINCCNCQHYEGIEELGSHLEPEHYEFRCSTLENSTREDIETLWDNWCQGEEKDDTKFATKCPHFQTIAPAIA